MRGCGGCGSGLLGGRRPWFGLGGGLRGFGVRRLCGGGVGRGFWHSRGGSGGGVSVGLFAGLLAGLGGGLHFEDDLAVVAHVGGGQGGILGAPLGEELLKTLVAREEVGVAEVNEDV